MANDETVAAIATAMRRMETVFGHLYWCEYANRIIAAHNREILVERHLADEYLAAKDAEIERLRRHYQDMLKRIVQKDKGANDEK